MNARIAKEIRLLLPISIGGAALLVLVPQVLESIGLNLSALFFIFFVVCVILGIASFGRDVAGDTLSQMLSQPLKRSVLWKEKILVSGVFLGALTVVFHLVLIQTMGESFGYYFVDGYFLFGLVFPVFAFCVGPLLALTTRQMTASFWLLILSGGIVFAMVTMIGDWLPLGLLSQALYFGTANSLVFGGLSIVAFIQARKRFVNYEDTSSFSREITLSLGRLLPFLKAKEAAVQQTRSSTWSLFKKELHLQQVNYVFIFGCYAVLFLHQMILAPGIIKEAQTGMRNDQFILDAIAVAARLVAGIAPFIIGGVAIAEERRYGVEEWQLLLPVSRLKQWSIKLITCLSLSFALGGGFIFAVDWLANLFPQSMVLSKFGEVWMDVTPLQNFLYYVVFPIIALSLGMMASSVARNYLQSLSIQMGIGISLFMLSVLAIWFINDRFSLLANAGGITSQNLYLIIGLPLFVLTSLTLSYQNYSRLGGFSVKLKRTLIFVSLLLIFTFSSTTFAYFRVFDFVLLPSPAKSKYAQSGEVTPSFSVYVDHGVAIGSDGTLWRWGFDVTKYQQFRELSVAERQISIDSDVIEKPLRVGSDSNWKQVIAKRGGFLALKNDGTLWALGGYIVSGGNFDGMFYSALGIDHIAQNLTRVGNDNNWQKITGEHYYRSLGLKDDGTVWSWGIDRVTTLEHERSARETIFPSQVGSDTDWVDIASHDGTNFALKKDGSIWMWGTSPQNPDNGFGFEERDSQFWIPTLFYDEAKIEAIHADARTLLAKREDGRVLVWGVPGSRWIEGGQNGNPPWLLNAELDWRNTNYEFSLLDDGWLAKNWGYIDPALRPITMFGDNWVEHHDRYTFFYAMTRDGTLWYWGQNMKNWFSSDDDEKIRFIPDRYHPKPMARLRAEAD